MNKDDYLTDLDEVYSDNKPVRVGFDIDAENEEGAGEIAAFLDSVHDSIRDNTNNCETAMEYYIAVERMLKKDDEFCEFFNMDSRLLACKFTMMKMYQNFAYAYHDEEGEYPPVMMVNIGRCRAGEKVMGEVTFAIQNNAKADYWQKATTEVFDGISKVMNHMMQIYGYETNFIGQVSINSDLSNEENKFLA
jgi:hypothetical protein